MVFARWLHREGRVLLLDEPTRGVDVGARAELYDELDRIDPDGRRICELIMAGKTEREMAADLGRSQPDRGPVRLPQP